MAELSALRSSQCYEPVPRAPGVLIPMKTILFLFACGWALCTSRAFAAEELKLLLLGDSITLGMNQPALLSDLKAQLEAGTGPGLTWSIVCSGVGGETARNGRKRVKALLDQHRPQYVSIAYGCNDMYYTEAKKKAEAFRPDLEALLAEIQGHACKPVVLLRTCTPIVDEKHQFRNDPDYTAAGGMNAYLDRRINPQTRAIGHEKQLAFVDAHRIFRAQDPSKLIRADGIHLTPEGNKLLAQSIAAPLAALVRAQRLKQSEALANAKKAADLLGQARAAYSNGAAGAEKAKALLNEAARTCSYLAETYVLLDALEQPAKP
ncbi:MAG: hypothetical protein AMXMBFR7_26050 [Planctomycetota bacterium]